MPLAGIGSRFIAALLDSLILFFSWVVLTLLRAMLVPALGVFGSKAASWGLGVYLLGVFLLFWGYFALFETFNNGRTPGKQVAKIRVIHQSGRGVSFVEALGRNLVRYIDFLPFFYGVGITTMFLSRRHQRLGDMVAGTLVVREREVDAPTWGESAARTFTAASLPQNVPVAPSGSATMGSDRWTGQAGFPLVAGSQNRSQWGGAPHLRVMLPAPALAKLAPSDLEVLEGFFARRLDMDLTTRAGLAQRIATALCAKSGLAIPVETSVETFLEAVAHQFREVGRMS